MKLTVTNLLTPPANQDEEYFETLLQRPDQVERIVSSGQATPAGGIVDQAWDEWVLLLAGATFPQIEGENEERRLLPVNADGPCRRTAATRWNGQRRIHRPSGWTALG